MKLYIIISQKSVVSIINTVLSIKTRLFLRKLQCDLPTLPFMSFAFSSTAKWFIWLIHTVWESVTELNTWNALTIITSELFCTGTCWYMQKAWHVLDMFWLFQVCSWCKVMTVSTLKCFYQNKHNTKINIYMKFGVFWDTMLCNLIISHGCFERNCLPKSSGYSSNSKLHVKMVPVCKKR